jgi:DNA polymerase-3 subunit chi
VIEIDFYILNRGSGDNPLTLACRLAEKAVDREHRVLINTGSEADSARLNELLWTFSQGSFLPHRLLADGQADDEGEPIAIGSGHEPPAGSSTLMINLAPDVPRFFTRFSRIAELVDAGEDDKAAGRERFRYYRDQGCELRTHHV